MMIRLIMILFCIQRLSLAIPSSRLTSKGYGQDDPKYSNDTEDGKAQNRNVQFLISANDKMKADAKKEAGSN